MCEQFFNEVRGYAVSRQESPGAGAAPKGKFPKKGGRRLVSGLLALVLCLTLVPVIYADTVVTVTSWYAAGAFEENTLYWGG